MNKQQKQRQQKTACEAGHKAEKTGYVWPVFFYAETHGHDGKKHVFSGTVEGAGDECDLIAQVNERLGRHPNKHVFDGCELSLVSLLGQKSTRIINPDTLEVEPKDRTPPA